MLSKKRQISLSEINDDLITKASESPIKKKSMIDIPKGYEVVLIEADGTTEIIRNVHQYKLDRDVHALFYAKTNTLVKNIKWGTRSRITIVNKQDQKQLLGAFGVISYALKNPIRYINKQMHSKTDLTVEALTNLVIDHITDCIRTAVKNLKINTENDSLAIETITPLFIESLHQKLDDFGIEIQSLTIENINFQMKEGN